MSQLEFRAAVRDAIAEELERDPTVLFFGEDVAAPGGVFAVTGGLQERFGPQRVFDTPISELALAGAAFGAAVTGMRPVVEVMFGDFMGLAMDSLVNQAAKLWYVSNEQHSVPLVIRSAVGAGGRFGAMHSQNHGTWFQGVPGLKVVAPSSPGDAKGLLKAAIRDDNPVIFLEHKRLYSLKGPAPRRFRWGAQQWCGREPTSRSSRSRRGCGTRSMPPRLWPETGSKRRSSTCARCDPWTSRQCSRR
jgi:acetoin:2,6-dichlorophenolindophenol oxidoreductase subunit beta